MAFSARKDWFSELFGFPEGEYDITKRQLQVEEDPADPGMKIMKGPNGRTFRAGRFSTPSLAELRACPECAAAVKGKLRVTNVIGDVAAKLADRGNRHATFQVASQFNCLEFVGPSVTPEHGITGYVMDRTQGPACSIACGPATAFRNYFAPVRRPDGKWTEAACS
ncbi:unnamed protein product [Effrenium voratum]|nr:unnamed protein product [Effrenium voratum]